MRKHPYLRAYMAGITVPTVFLLVILTLFSATRFHGHTEVPIERIIVFPMAVVPNLWGVWNMLYVGLRSYRRLPVGLHGALLPFLLAPLGWAVARALHFEVPPFVAAAFPMGFPVALVIYYLVWKHVVGFFNEILEIGE